MSIQAHETRPVNAIQVTAKCPRCGKSSILEALAQDIVVIGDTACGQRRCPDPDCHAHMFVVVSKSKVLASYPPARIDFDPRNIPAPVLAPFEEALNCLASGYHTASAIMIRRTLESICDERGAKGKDLKDRISDLASKVIIPGELLDGMDELRILGNDAAHVNAISYLSISEEELAIAAEFAKEILKALYQYAALLDRLRALKKPASA